MQFKITLQALQTDQALAAVQAAIITPQEMLLSVGESLLRVNQDRHRQGVAPDGKRWKELSPLTIGSAIWNAQGKSFRNKRQMSLATARKVQAKKSTLLYGHGDLLNSFNYQLHGSDLMLGFSDQKAVWHQFGTGTYGPRGTSYMIKPKNAKALAFAGMVRKQVEHPGIPARELIGFPASDEQLVSLVIQSHLQGRIARGG